MIDIALLPCNSLRVYRYVVKCVHVLRESEVNWCPKRNPKSHNSSKPSLFESVKHSELAWSRPDCSCPRELGRASRHRRSPSNSSNRPAKIASKLSTCWWTQPKRFSKSAAREKHSMF